MTVKELIENLQKHDPEKEVRCEMIEQNRVSVSEVVSNPEARKGEVTIRCEHPPIPPLQTSSTFPRGSGNKRQ